MGSKEILTLQFGHYSNFVGTHWWNIQESGFEYNFDTPSEIDHGVLFREGFTGRGEVTFTPRVLLVDLKGSLGTLSESGNLYDDPLNPSKVGVNWPENVEVQHDQTGSQKNEFLRDLENARDLTTLSTILHKPYNLDSSIKVWSDYFYSKFHPRTVNIVNEYQHCNENTPFDAFPLGTSLWKSAEFEDNFCDKIRNYVEECDRFQGFYLLTDSTNAFSGLSASCLEYLQDEYDRKSILTLPLIPSHFEDNIFETDEQKHQSIINDSTRVLNLVLGFSSFNEHSSLFVPLCTSENGWRQPGNKKLFYHTEYNHELPYHSSAILASALETFTLKHRLKSETFSLVDLCADLNANGRKAAAASVCLPFSLNKDADFIECLDAWEGPLSQSLTPRCTIGTERIMQHITLRGVPEERLKKPPAKAGKQKDMPAYNCNSIDEMLTFYLACTTHATANNTTVVHKPMPVRSPYPLIFDKKVGVNGNIGIEDRSQNLRVDSVPILAGLHSTPGIGDMLESLHTEARKIKLAKFHQFTSSGIERDEFEDCLDKIFELRENYEDNYVI